jgi:ketosteroid isomerase-like protein
VSPGQSSTSWWSASPTPEDDRLAVSALDLEFQAAVKRNDAGVMDRILHPEFAQFLGDGTLVCREDVIDAARMRLNIFEIHNEDEGTQTVRVWGDTAVVTARLRIKGTNQKEPFDRTFWFSDTYIRTPTGWRNVFAQASLALPPGQLTYRQRP